jgi:hypothetical protein
MPVGTNPTPRKSNMETTPPQSSTPEKYMIAFVIQGDDVFRITAESVQHTQGTANELAFQGVAKLKAAAALMQLTALHNERPDELRQMAREMAAEGMRLLGRSTNPTPTQLVDKPQEASVLDMPQEIRIA